ncbi:MAG: GTPase [Thermodesulfobacteriota bacterium]|nr:GTPase [Thermodesulfobacteriota bacterium]
MISGPDFHFGSNKLRALQPDLLWEAVQCPGLTQSAKDINHLKKSLARQLKAFNYKHKKSLLWVVFIGGTGTGKSTLFNALCGSYISETGVERPKTAGTIAYVHKKTPLEDNFPFPEFEVKRIREKNDGSPNIPHVSRNFIVVEHARDDISHLVLTDTPDLDSLEIQNRQMAEDLYLLADVIVFITSQEKYADDVPSRFLYRIHREGKPYFFLFNKADPVTRREEVFLFFQNQDLKIQEDRFRLIPYMQQPSVESISNQQEFRKFTSAFFQESGKDKLLQLLQDSETRNAQNLKDKIDFLLNLLEDEKKAGQKWTEGLYSLFEDSSQYLLSQTEARHEKESRNHIQNEIRKIFNKYDVLARPRRYVTRFFLIPLRLLGLKKRETPESHRKELLKAGQRVDISPVLTTVDRFNRLVLERLSPADDTSSLLYELRQPDIALTGEEIREKIQEEQENLADWLEEAFQDLARGIPKSKELGIYSMSILWGILILSFEVVLGGGITFLEAALDTVIAPLITKGSVNLFAYHELQKIARELNQRYQDGLLSILREQRNRYESCLVPLLTSQETIEALRSLRGQMENFR